MLSHRFTTSYLWIVCITATLLMLTLLCVKQSVELRHARRQQEATEKSFALYRQQSGAMIVSLDTDRASARRETERLHARLDALQAAALQKGR